MKFRIKNTALILLILMMASVIASCGSAAANQNAVPHDITAKVLSELKITAQDLANEGEEDPEIAEYYSASEDFYLDSFNMSVLFPYIGDENDLTGEDFADYSIINCNRTKMFPFEIVIIKLPKKDGKVDADLLKSVQNLCEAKIKNLVTHVEQYSQSVVNMVKKVSVKTYDNYVYYCFAENASTAEDIIKNAITAAE